MQEAKNDPMDQKPQQKLGRGLGRLIPVKAPVAVTAVIEPVRPAVAIIESAQANAQEAGSRRVLDIAIGSISPNARQPRRDFEPKAIRELADSIRHSGLLQPVIVRPIVGSPGQFELIAGERRWRACKELGWTAIPAMVMQATDQDSGVWALIENVHRVDLNPMDRSAAIQRLASEFQLTHEALAERIGLDRTTVTNLLRLAELDPVSSQLVRKGVLTQGHAKALMGVSNPKTRGTLAESAARGDWSVRALEQEVQRLNRASADVPRGTPASRRKSNIDGLEKKISQALGTEVRIITGRKPNTGKLSIAFYSIEQFEGILSSLGLKQNQIKIDE
jgi:ParB family chromosome partitioning protein